MSFLNHSQRAQYSCLHGRSSVQYGSYTLARHLQRWSRRAAPTLAVQDEKVQGKTQPPAVPPNRSRKQQQAPPQPTSSHTDSASVLQQIQQQWNQLDWRQRGYAVVLGLVVLAVVPQVLALLLLLLERVIVAALLEFEQAFVAFLFKGGAVVGIAVLIGLVVSGVYLFAKKATK